MDLISLRAPISSRFLCPRAPVFNIQRAQPEPPSDRQASQQNFAGANFRSDEISLQWMRNFAKMTAKFRLTKIRECFDEISGRNLISRNFVEFSREQGTINTKFCLHFFCTDQNCVSLLGRI